MKTYQREYFSAIQFTEYNIQSRQWEVISLYHFVQTSQCESCLLLIDRLIPGCDIIRQETLYE